MIKFEKLNRVSSLDVKDDLRAEVKIDSSNILKGSAHLFKVADATLASVGVAGVVTATSVKANTIKMHLFTVLEKEYEVASSATSLNLGYALKPGTASGDITITAGTGSAALASSNAVNVNGTLTLTSSTTAGKIKVKFPASVIEGTASLATANDSTESCEVSLKAGELHIDAVCRVKDSENEWHPNSTSCTVRPAGAIDLVAAS